MSSIEVSSSIGSVKREFCRGVEHRKRSAEINIARFPELAVWSCIDIKRRIANCKTVVEKHLDRFNYVSTYNVFRFGQEIKELHI